MATLNRTLPNFPCLPPHISTRSLPVGDLDMFILEALPLSQPDQNSAPLVLLLHGFPELAYSWRKLIVPLADAGYHVVAPDLRGYGWTVPCHLPADAKWAVQYDDDLTPYRMSSIVTDVVGLVQRLEYSSAAVIGHDFGSLIAGHCALIRPDMFKAVVMMSAPLAGVPDLDPATGRIRSQSAIGLLNAQLAQLDPPRKHYTMYFSSPHANDDMMNAPEGLHDFFRAYFHVKSADWAENAPHRLPDISAATFALLPHYYVMQYNDTMSQTVRPYAPSAAEVKACAWLTEAELEVYATEYRRTGIQGGLNYYRCLTNTQWSKDLLLFSGQKITVPSMFLSGKQDWGVYQFPGAVEVMKENFCTSMIDEDFVLVDGAGHWVQQEKPDEVLHHLIPFLRRFRV